MAMPNFPMMKSTVIIKPDLRIYRDYSDHIDFANQRFCPIAGDRITNDFSEVIGHAEVKTRLGTNALVEKTGAKKRMPFLD